MGLQDREDGRVAFTVEMCDVLSWMKDTQVFFLPSLCLKYLRADFLEKGDEASLTPYSCH